MNDEKNEKEYTWRPPNGTSWADGFARNISWGLVVVAVWLIALIVLTSISPYR